MRRRKRPEYRVRSYKYWARPLGELPETFWRLAHTMRETWNSIVEAWEKTAESARTLPKDEQKAVWTTHRETCRRIVAESGLNWECGPEILERFETACRMAARGERGWPKRQDETRSVMIPHCYNNGGTRVAALFRMSRRLALRPVPLEAYANSRRETVRQRLTRGTFGFAGGSIEFETILHRPIPDAAFVKRCAWTGKHHPIKGWRWFIIVTIEEPPVPARESDKTVAIETGWRVFGDAIRVAMAVDQDGFVQELRLPIDGARSHERRHNIPSGWRDLAVIDSQIANLLEGAKVELRSLSAPESCCDPMSHLARMQQGGLVRLLRQLDENGSWPEASAVLRKWKPQNDRLRSIRACLSERLTGRRRWLYRNFAAQICRNYGTVILKKMPIQRLSQSGDVLDSAARYRQWASPAELSLYLRQAAMSTGTVVKEAESAFSTTTCAECGAQATQTGNVILTCPTGHSWDQDENAARNLLSQMCSDSLQLSYVRKQWPERLQSKSVAGAASGHE
jgi:hypothetical protein